MDKEIPSPDLTPSPSTDQLLLGMAIGAGGMILAGLTVVVYQNKRRKERIKSSRHSSSNSQPLLSPSTGSSRRSSSGDSDSRTMSPGRQFRHFTSLLESLPEESPSHSTSSNNVRTSKSSTSSNNNYDQKKEGELLLGLLHKVGEVQTNHDNILHRGISCNICGLNPLTGTRFKCVNCVDYDICAQCAPKADHDITHLLMKITVPIPPLANPRTALLPVLYPGKKVISKTLPWSEILRLRDESHFDTSYIKILYDQYRSLCTSKEGITKDTFYSTLGPLTSKKNLVVEQLFRFYDADGDGFINFNDFVNGMSILGKGTKKERMKYIFQGYDIDKDGFISKEDFKLMFQAYHQLSMELVRDVVRSCEEEMMASYDDSGNRPISAVFNAPIPDTSDVATGSNAALWSKKLRSLSVNNSTSPDEFTYDVPPSTPKLFKSLKDNRLPAVEAMTQDAIVELIDQIMVNADLDLDGKLSEKEFCNYSHIDPSLLAWFESIDTVF